jgi:hypothetical protein
MLSWTINVTESGLSEEQVAELSALITKEAEITRLLIAKETQKIMSEITDLRDQVKADNAVIAANLANINQDMIVLDAKITELLNNGSLTPEDRAALAEIKTLSAGQVTATQALADQHPDVPPAA